MARNQCAFQVKKLPFLEYEVQREVFSSTLGNTTTSDGTHIPCPDMAVAQICANASGILVALAILGIAFRYLWAGVAVPPSAKLNTGTYPDIDEAKSDSNPISTTAPVTPKARNPEPNSEPKENPQPSHPAVQKIAPIPERGTAPTSPTPTKNTPLSFQQGLHRSHGPTPIRKGIVDVPTPTPSTPVRRKRKLRLLCANPECCQKENGKHKQAYPDSTWFRWRTDLPCDQQGQTMISCQTLPQVYKSKISNLQWACSLNCLLTAERNRTKPRKKKRPESVDDTDGAPVLKRRASTYPVSEDEESNASNPIDLSSASNSDCEGDESSPIVVS